MAMYFGIVIYTACKSLAEIAKLLNWTKKYDLEGWQTKPPVGVLGTG